ncbi:hypothetical protein OS493_026715 [Desmophyllum pertusum]|uniref:Uncharacterized protein n=1 Tax=Desmophyllum pertusum TaxID=174260 RepID=A0A9W9ZZE9_9CNID|nr:hypothetical protein OS493_026715 [Desmophyllum pertusum]
MSKTEESSKVYLWQGEADAVGWYKDNNEVGNICHSGLESFLTSWIFGRRNQAHMESTYNQCLVYAKLLQLHLQLNLPASHTNSTHLRNNWTRHHPFAFL